MTTIPTAIIFVAAIIAFIDLILRWSAYLDIHSIREKYRAVEDFKRKVKETKSSTIYISAEAKENALKNLVIEYSNKFGEDFNKYID